MPKAVYNPATKTLTVTGTLMAAGQAARRHQRPHLRRRELRLREAEGARLRDDRERRRLHRSRGGSAEPPKWIYAYVYHYRYPICSGPSSAPAGCASQSTDGVATDEVPVKTGSTTPSA